MPVSTDSAVPSSVATTPVGYDSNRSSIDSMSVTQNSSVRSMGSSLAVPQNVPPATSVPPAASPMNAAMTPLPQGTFHSNPPPTSMPTSQHSSMPTPQQHSSMPTSQHSSMPTSQHSSMPTSQHSSMPLSSVSGVIQNVSVAPSVCTSDIQVQASIANSPDYPSRPVASSGTSMPVPLNIPVPPTFSRNVPMIMPQHITSSMHTSSPIAFPGLSPAPPPTSMMVSPQSSPHPSNSSASLGGYPQVPDCSMIKTEEDIKTETVIKQEADNTEKPHKCEACGRCYKKLTGLYSHKRYECGKPPIHFCPVCPTKCKQKGNLVAHLKRKHPDFAESYSTKRGSTISHRFTIPLSGQQFPVAPLLYNPHYFHHRSMQESEQRKPAPVKTMNCKDTQECSPELRQFTDLMPPVKPQHSQSHQQSHSSQHQHSGSMMRQSSSSTTSSSHHSGMMRQTGSSHHHNPDVGSSKNQCEVQQPSLSLADLTNPSNDGKGQQGEDDFSSFSIQQYYL